MTSKLPPETAWCCYDIRENTRTPGFEYGSIGYGSTLSSYHISESISTFSDEPMTFTLRTPWSRETMYWSGGAKTNLEARQIIENRFDQMYCREMMLDT